MSGLILALDLEDKSRALEIVRDSRDMIDYAKLGYPIILRNGLSVIGEISRYVPVISDLKIADIPDVSYDIARKLVESGSTGFIAHGFVGRDVLLKLRSIKAKFYVVAEMSHPGSLEFISPVSDKIALLAKEIGSDGIVAPATRPDRIHHLKKLTNLEVISPGINTQGGSIKATLEAGADYIIVGRSITNSSDPREAILKIKEEMRL